MNRFASRLPFCGERSSANNRIGDILHAHLGVLVIDSDRNDPGVSLLLGHSATHSETHSSYQYDQFKSLCAHAIAVRFPQSATARREPFVLAMALCLCGPDSSSDSDSQDHIASHPQGDSH